MHISSNGALADPAECKQIADLGVDFLACGIGNIHGVYPADWAGLSFERLGEIKAETDAEARKLGERTGLDTLVAVSYTHLDVYKRQT